MGNKSYQVVGASARDHVPSGYYKAKTLINENQELANDWRMIKTHFNFFKTRFNVIDKTKSYVIGTVKDQIIVAKQFKQAWVVCQGTKLGKKSAGKAFASAKDAFDKACNALFTRVDEDEED